MRTKAGWRASADVEEIGSSQFIGDEHEGGRRVSLPIFGERRVGIKG